MTKDERELLYSQIILYKNPEINKILLSSISDKNLKDLAEINQLDDTYQKRFCKNYYRYITRQIKEHQDSYLMSDENYNKFLSIVNEYYLKILKDFVAIQPSYIYGVKSESHLKILRDQIVHDDILKYVQNIFMSFLSSENQTIYKFVCNNDCPGLAAHYIDKYKDINIDYFLNDMTKIWSELIFINGIHIIGKSPVSLFHQENYFKRSFERYLKDSGLKDLYIQLEKDKVKKASSIDAIKIIKAFIENYEFASVGRFYEKYYPDRNYSVDVALIKQFDPELYIEYSEKVQCNSKIQYAILTSTGRKLKYAILEYKYRLPFLEFLKIYNPKTLPALIQYYRKTIKNLPEGIYGVLNSYLRRVNMSAIDMNDVKTSRVVINGRELTLNEKLACIEYIKKNNLPYMARVYNEVYRGYLNGSIDLNKPFKEESEE